MMFLLTLLMLVRTVKIYLAAELIEYEVDEMAPVNYLIGSLAKKAQLMEKYPATYSQLQFFMQPSMSSRYLRVEKTSGNLFVKFKIDRESLCMNFPSSCCPSQQRPLCSIPLAVSVGLPTVNGGHDLKEVLSVGVIIKDINDSPCKFVPRDVQTVQFRENDPIDTRETLNTPRDPDAEFGVLQSRIKLQEPSNIFALSLRELPSFDPKYKLELVLKGLLDRELQDNYELTIRADDGNTSHACHLRVKVEVLDANDQTPVFVNSSYSLLVREDHPIDEPLIKVKATDNDLGENGRLTYEIDASVTTVQVLDNFAINRESGEITLSRRLDAAKATRYAVPIIAKDSARRSLTGSTMVIINVLDLNDNDPVVNILDISGTGAEPSLLEEQPPGVDVATIRVSDADKGVNGQINCIMMNSDRGAFVLKEFIGQNGMYKVTSQISLDREQLKDDNPQVFVNFQIKCNDGGIPSRSVTSSGKVLLLDINDNSPIFHNQQTIVSILEDSAPQRLRQNFRILQMNATDEDYGINAALTWSVQELTANDMLKNNDIFVIDGLGLISSRGRPAKKQLDREFQAKYRLLVTVVDGGRPALTASTIISLNLLDYNDNTPFFQNTSYTDIYVTENAPIGQLVTSLVASDADLGPNAQLFYSISADSHDQRIPFRVETQTVIEPGGGYRYVARIFTDSFIDREAFVNGDRNVQAAYNFKIRVRDSPLEVSQRRFSEARVQVKVLDVNDQSPEWKQPDVNNTLHPVSYLEPKGYSVVTMLATDMDASENGSVSYRLISGNRRGVFLLNSRNGSLQIARDLTSSDIGTYSLTIDAEDQGRESLRSSIHFKIRVDNSRPRSIQSMTTSNTDSFNLYIIVAIIVTSFIIAMVLLTAICIVLRRSRQRSLSNGPINMYKPADFQLSYPASPITSPVNRCDTLECTAAVPYPPLQSGNYNNTLQRREVTFACNEPNKDPAMNSRSRPPPYQHLQCVTSQKICECDREHDGDSGNGDSVDVMTTPHTCCMTSSIENAQGYSTLPSHKMRTFTVPNTNTISSTLSGADYHNMVDSKCMFSLGNCVADNDKYPYNGSATLGRDFNHFTYLNTLRRADVNEKSSKNSSFV